MFKKPRPILQLSLDGDFIAEYPSAYQAAFELEIDVGSICKCANNKRHSTSGTIVRTVNRYIWKWVDQS